MRKCKFNLIWKEEEQFKRWLIEDECSIFSFKCKKCQVTLDLGNMGRTAVLKHMKTRKHIDIGVTRKSQSSELLKAWTKSSERTASLSASTSSNNLNISIVSSNLENDHNESHIDSVPTLNQWISSESVLRAEIMWVINIVFFQQYN